MTHKDFEEDLDSLSQVTLDNLKLAAEEDLQKKPITEPNVCKLMKHLKVTAGSLVQVNPRHLFGARYGVNVLKLDH